MEDGTYLRLSRSNAGWVKNLAGARSRDLKGTLAGNSGVLLGIARIVVSVGRDGRLSCTLGVNLAWKKPSGCLIAWNTGPSAEVAVAVES